ncbi:MAG: hypothetical protein ACR2JP_06515 [Acidimicrobiia bacterium]
MPDSPHRPSFIVVEGPNGAGKSTVAKGLSNAMGMTLLRYPDRFLAFRERIDLDHEVAPVARLLYYLAGIADLSDAVSATPGAVVCDRYWASPLAALEAGGDLPTGVIDRVSRPVLAHIARPGLTILLGARPAVLAARIDGRDETRSSASYRRTLHSPAFADEWMARLRARSGDCGPIVEIDTTDRSIAATIDLAARCVGALIGPLPPT